MKELFDWKGKFNDDIIKWNVSNVTDMSWIFINIRFNDDISGWDVSSATNMDTWNAWIACSVVHSLLWISLDGMSVVLLACGVCSAIPSFIGTSLDGM